MSDSIKIKDLVAYLKTLDQDYRIEIQDGLPFTNAADAFERAHDHYKLRIPDAVYNDMRDGLKCARDEVHVAYNKYESSRVRDINASWLQVQHDINKALTSFEEDYLTRNA